MIRLICEPLQKLCKKAKFLTFIYTLYYLCHVALSSDAALLLFVFTFYHVVHPREYPETHRYKNSFAVHSAAWRKHSDSENRARSWRWVRPRAGRSGAWRTTSWSGDDNDDNDEYNDHNDFVIRIPNGSGASKEAAKTYNGLSVPRMVRILRPSTSGSSKVEYSSRAVTFVNASPLFVESTHHQNLKSLCKI